MPKSYKTKWFNGKQVRLHRFVVEQVIGRKLSDSELVHHINGDIHDNHPENLQIVTRAEHKRIHPEIGKKTRFKKVLHITKHELEKFYIKEKRPMHEIAVLFNVTQPTIHRQIKLYGIERKIACATCGRKADYIKSERCNKCYQREYRELLKSSSPRRLPRGT